jgi:hypothetical protein
VKIIALVCGLLSGVLGALAALAFLKGSKPIPWDLQSYAGSSEAEKKFQALALRWNKFGVGLLLAAFVFSAGASIASYCE